MFARCGLEVEFDFSLPKQKKTRTDDYSPHDRSKKVEAKRRDLKERIKAELAVNNHYDRPSPSILTSPTREKTYANRNNITSTGDGLVTTRSVTQAEYDLFKANKRVERYAL